MDKRHKATVFVTLTVLMAASSAVFAANHSVSHVFRPGGVWEVAAHSRELCIRFALTKRTSLSAAGLLAAPLF